MKKPGNLLVLTQWSFKDALVQTYTLPYVDMIRQIISPDRKIFLVTAEQKQIALSKEEEDQINKEWARRNMQLVTEPYKRMGFKKMMAAVGNLFRLVRVIHQEKIETIHAFCTPAGSMGYLLSSLTGAELIIDSYEPHAEAMVENGTWKKNGAAYKILFTLEKKQTQKAKAVIATTAGMKQYARDKYGMDIKNFYVKPACVDTGKFFPREKNPVLIKELKLENKIVCVYAGKLGGIYFNEETFDFIKACHDYWKDDFRFLLLTNAAKEEIEQQISRVGLPENTVISFFVLHQDIPRYLSLGDFAINPVKPVPTKKYCTSIKDAEYWAMGLPVVISPDISDDSEIIERHRIGVVMDYGNPENYLPALRKIEELLQNNPREILQKRIVSAARQYRSFEVARKIYPLIYES